MGRRAERQRGKFFGSGRLRRANGPRQKHKGRGDRHDAVRRAQHLHDDGPLRDDDGARIFQRKQRGRLRHLRRLLQKKPRRRRLRNLRGAGAGARISRKPALRRTRHRIPALAENLRRRLPALALRLPLPRRRNRYARRQHHVPRRTHSDRQRAAHRRAARRNRDIDADKPPVAHCDENAAHSASTPPSTARAPPTSAAPTAPRPSSRDRCSEFPSAAPWPTAG